MLMCAIFTTIQPPSHMDVVKPLAVACMQAAMAQRQDSRAASRHCPELPPEIWADISGKLTAVEWCRGAGMANKVLSSVQPLQLVVAAPQSDRPIQAAAAALLWTVRHWGQARKLQLNLFSSIERVGPRQEVFEQTQEGRQQGQQALLQAMHACAAAPAGRLQALGCSGLESLSSVCPAWSNDVFSRLCSLLCGHACTARGQTGQNSGA